MRQQLKRESKLLASLDAKLGDKKMAMADQEGADAEVFPAAKARWTELAKSYEFGDAIRAILEAKVTTTKRKKEKEILAGRARYLEQFKVYVLIELRNEGWPKPVVLKDGTTVAAGSIAKMDDTRMYLREKSGEKAVKWSEFSPGCIFAMAQSPTTPDEEATKAAFRKWHLGNYAALIGKTEEARKLKTGAAKADEEYEPELAGLLETVK